MKPSILASLGGIGLIASAQAAVVISDAFDTDLGNWSSTGSSTYHTTTPFGAAALNTEVGTGNPLVLSNALNLASEGATQITIAFTGQWGSANSSTRWFDIQYSTNNGANWTQGVRYNAAAQVTSGSFTVSSGLTDQFLWRFMPKNDGNSSLNDFTYYLNTTTITHDGTVIPEPSSVLLCGLGALMLLRRRRA